MRSLSKGNSNRKNKKIIELSKLLREKFEENPKTFPWESTEAFVVKIEIYCFNRDGNVAIEFGGDIGDFKIWTFGYGRQTRNTEEILHEVINCDFCRISGYEHIPSIVKLLNQ